MNVMDVRPPEGCWVDHYGIKRTRAGRIVWDDEMRGLFIKLWRDPRNNKSYLAQRFGLALKVVDVVASRLVGGRRPKEKKKFAEVGKSVGAPVGAKTERSPRDFSETSSLSKLPAVGRSPAAPSEFFGGEKTKNQNSTRVERAGATSEAREAEEPSARSARPALEGYPITTHPIDRALFVLNGRAAASARGVFTLDGRTATAKQVVEAANAALRRHNQPLIAYPGVWTPEVVR